VARSSSDDTAIRYALPVLWMTSYTHMMETMGQSQARRYVSSSSPGSGTAGEVCRFRLHLVSFCSRKTDRYSGPVQLRKNKPKESTPWCNYTPPDDWVVADCRPVAQTPSAAVPSLGVRRSLSCV